jgi:hypothetical protein
MVLRSLLLLLLVSLVHGNEQRLLLTGCSWHETSRDQFGERYNAFNAGIGYEWNRFETYREWYFTGNVMLFNDSFRHPQLTVGFGHAMRFEGDFVDTSVGLAGFVGVKKLYEADDRVGTTGKYGFMGGIAPAVSFYRGPWSLNLIYVPSVDIGDYDITGFLFGYFGWRF